MVSLFDLYMLELCDLITTQVFIYIHKQFVFKVAGQKALKVNQLLVIDQSSLSNLPSTSSGGTLHLYGCPALPRYVNLDE